MRKKCNLTLILFFLLLTSYSFAQQRETSPIRFEKISARLYEITGGQGARGGVYIGNNSVLLIDAKMDKKSVDQIIEEIQKKLTNAHIKYLVNTHSDADHTRGNQYFPDTVTIISHENCRKEMLLSGRDGSPSEWNRPELAPFVPSITFQEKMDIHLGPTKIELWYFGIGHTTGDIVVFFPEEKTAFIGDQIFIGRTPLIHSYKGGNSFGNVKNLEKMLETINAEKFYSGHSDIADREEIRNQIDLMKKRQEKVKTLIKKEKSLEEIKLEFEKDEARLVETIYNEIASPRM